MGGFSYVCLDTDEQVRLVYVRHLAIYSEESPRQFPCEDTS